MVLEVGDFMADMPMMVDRSRVDWVEKRIQEAIQKGGNVKGRRDGKVRGKKG